VFEHKSKPVIPVHRYLKRQLGFLFYSAVILATSLGIGVLGYHFTARLSWLDSLLNASMILTGRGPVNVMLNRSSKLFASAYALFSGIVFLSTVAVLFAPAVHRFLHTLQIDPDPTNSR
jgi:hypothetical protein